MNNNLHAIVLAGGKGSRMGSDIPKVLIPLCGKPMILYVLDILNAVEIQNPVIVVGSNRQKIIDALGSRYYYAVQEEQLGSGHAVMCAKEFLPNDGYLIVMCGDSPLFRAETISSLISHHINTHAAITLVSATLDEPYGYGRVVRNAEGSILGIAEEGAATTEEKLIKEVNGGCYAFDARWLWNNIGLMTQNAAGEYCLTEMVNIAVSQGLPIEAVTAYPHEIQGVNTYEQLLYAERIISQFSDNIDPYS